MLFCVAFVVACDDASVFADRAHERSSDLLKRSCSVMVITVHITVYTHHNARNDKKKPKKPSRFKMPLQLYSYL